jgi:phage shock protein PspC (stress-responsive transcriptional regulator)
MKGVIGTCPGEFVGMASRFEIRAAHLWRLLWSQSLIMRYISHRGPGGIFAGLVKGVGRYFQLEASIAGSSR